MLSFNQVACRRDGVMLFDSVNFVLYAGQKVGLTGANGTGKSTLFSMILGRLEADEGELSLQQQVVVSHVAQETESSPRPALEYVIDGDAHLRACEAALESVGDDDGMRHAELLSDYGMAGGYDAHARAGSLLNGLGFATPQHQWPVSNFSGGWRMRLNLAQALMSPSDLLLLDEPTNHLDLDAVFWLEQWLLQREGGLILISHDREFLDRITSHTVHIEHRKVTLYTGNYTAFEQMRASRLANQQSAFEKQEQKRAAMQSFVDRFRAKATKARQAQSRLKMLERMTTIGPAQIDSPFHFGFRKPDALPSPLVVMRKAAIGYDGVPWLRDISLTVHTGDRIGLLGANGAGKSTLIKALVGDLQALSGERTPAQKLAIGYFAQHQVDQLRDDHSPLQALLAIDRKLADSQARTYLGGFDFRGDQVMQSARTLSGGERARLALALIVYQRPNLLLLDEPTNHLDIAMRQALANALQGFEGALIVVSHDRTLLRSVVDDLWLVDSGSLEPFDDDLDGYARWLSKRRQREAKSDGVVADVDSTAEKAPGSQSIPVQGLAAAVDGGGGVGNGQVANETATETLTPADRKERKREAAALREQVRPLRVAMERAEKQLEKQMAELSRLRSELAANDLYTDQNRQRLAKLLSQEATLKSNVEQAETVLLESMQALEHAEGAVPSARQGP